jgi:NADH:ubiquinone oxidoreductase subunit 6 (subunit J)
MGEAPHGGAEVINKNSGEMKIDQVFLFWIIAAMTGLSSIMVVVTQNIVRAATWLLFALGGTSGIFFLLGADFVGATQLLVYVGGTLVLVVFGVMLTAQGPFISMKTGAAEWGVAMIVGILLYGVLAISFFTGNPLTVVQPNQITETGPNTSLSSVTLGESLLGIEQASPPGNWTGAKLPANESSGSEEIKKVRKQVSYLLPFEIVSVHLLVVLIGAAYLARAKRRRGAIA